jgi:hypothetical protein
MMKDIIIEIQRDEFWEVGWSNVRFPSKPQVGKGLSGLGWVTSCVANCRVSCQRYLQRRA